MSTEQRPGDAAPDSPNPPTPPTPPTPPSRDAVPAPQAPNGRTGRDRAVDLTPTRAAPISAPRPAPRGASVADPAPDRTSDPASHPASDATADPLRLCIFATVALIAWLAGPWAVVAFAGLGFAGYWRARRAGLLRSKCLLGDTRVVLLYLGLLLAAGGWGVWHQLSP